MILEFLHAYYQLLTECSLYDTLCIENSQILELCDLLNNIVYQENDLKYEDEIIKICNDLKTLYQDEYD